MKLLSIDYQHDFASPGGRWYRPRPCEQFISNVLIPELRTKNIRVAEIVSDYRLPRPNETEAYCVPGEIGFESLIPDDVKSENIWIKCMNSPTWIRKNGSNLGEAPGVPRCDPDLFSQWLSLTIGSPQESSPVILMGLTLDCCVLSTAQELYYRGYEVRYLFEAVDSYFGTIEEKTQLFKTPLSMWGKPVRWQEIKMDIEGV